MRENILRCRFSAHDRSATTRHLSRKQVALSRRERHLWRLLAKDGLDVSEERPSKVKDKIDSLREELKREMAVKDIVPFSRLQRKYNVSLGQLLQLRREIIDEDLQCNPRSFADWGAS
jgi:hypothetical protein